MDRDLARLRPGAAAAVVHAAAPRRASSAPHPSRRAARGIRDPGARRLRAASGAWDLSGDLSTHDPALARDGDTWYVYSTGNGTVADGNVQVRSSSDGRSWRYEGEVWDEKPAWIDDAVPGVDNLWAPELVEHDGTWYLYYSASRFGKNSSVIALATNTTLDPDDPAYEWVDRGPVIASDVRRRLQRDRPGRRDRRRRHAVDVVRLVLERHPHGRARVAERAARRRRRAAPPRRPGCAAERDRGAVPRRARRRLVPLRLARQLLPGRRQHLQDRRRPSGCPDRAVRRPRRRAPARGRRHRAARDRGRAASAPAGSPSPMG